MSTARNKVYRTVNFAMVEAYWNIGKSIIDEQGGNEKAEYGTDDCTVKTKKQFFYKVKNKMLVWRIPCYTGENRQDEVKQ